MNAFLSEIHKRGWQPVIGLETHVQLLTESKIFSPASAKFGAAPNTQVHWIDAALPGVLPLVNAQAIEHAIRFGLAINAQVRRHSIFARKHYFYPDLPKAYQISQYESPIVEHGTLPIQLGHEIRVIDILRAHLEEDAGKLVHDLYPTESAIDLNRAGTPLIEVVTTPCMDSAEMAVAYARALHHLVMWIGICDGNMQEGSFRCDANVSLRRHDNPQLGTRCEIKNLNSFRFLEKAIEYEIERQADILESGGVIRQETRLFDPTIGQTQSMRSKEDAHDYRYFPDPDLLPIVLSTATLERIAQSLPILPTQLMPKLTQDYQLPAEVAESLLVHRAKAELFLQMVALIIAQIGKDTPTEKIAKTVANWMNGTIAGYLNDRGWDFAEIPTKAFSPQAIATLIARIIAGDINHNAGKTIFALFDQHRQQALSADSAWVDQLIDQQGLRQALQTDAHWQTLIDHAIQANPKAVEEYRAGKTKALMSLVGAVMKASAGKAPADKIQALLLNQLK